MPSGTKKPISFPTLFNEAIARINTDLSAEDITRLLADVKLLLDNEDLGNAFYDRLSERSGVRLIDFENFDNNSFHVVTELTCKNGDDEFRPDITLLINGMPLVFIEVKKPNNREGVLAERNRIITRCRNPRFRRFINITQLMVFSNNMEYDDGSPQPIEGAFYASHPTMRPSSTISAKKKRWTSAIFWRTKMTPSKTKCCATTTSTSSSTAPNS
jgi:type I restriction enzyme R subunit